MLVNEDNEEEDDPQKVSHCRKRLMVLKEADNVEEVDVDVDVEVEEKTKRPEETYKSCVACD